MNDADSEKEKEDKLNQVYLAIISRYQRTIRGAGGLIRCRAPKACNPK